MRLHWLPLCAVLALGAPGCVDDDQCEYDCVYPCGPGARCPDGYSCYGGSCMDRLPECLNPWP